MDSTGYISRLQEAIDFIEEHIQDTISAASVAAHVGFSEYHFHRIFSSALGESVAEYIRKRRLSEAATQLNDTSKPIMDIVLQCQFESQEAFTRAFKKMFGVTPGRYRTNIGNTYIKPKTTVALIEHLSGGLTMEPRIVTRESELAIGIASSFPPNSHQAIGKLWDKFLEQKHKIKNISAPYALGVCCPSLPQVKLQEGHTFVYMPALPVTSLDEIPPGMIGITLPQSRYAVFTHSGLLSNFPHTADYIWGTWLPKCKYQPKQTPDFEIYDHRWNSETMEGEIDIYVPIE